MPIGSRPRRVAVLRAKIVSLSQPPPIQKRRSVRALWLSSRKIISPTRLRLHRTLTQVLCNLQLLQTRCSTPPFSTLKSNSTIRMALAVTLSATPTIRRRAMALSASITMLPLSHQRHLRTAPLWRASTCRRV